MYCLSDHDVLSQLYPWGRWLLCFYAMPCHCCHCSNQRPENQTASDTNRSQPETCSRHAKLWLLHSSKRISNDSFLIKVAANEVFKCWCWRRLTANKWSRFSKYHLCYTNSSVCDSSWRHFLPAPDVDLTAAMRRRLEVHTWNLWRRLGSKFRWREGAMLVQRLFFKCFAFCVRDRLGMTCMIHHASISECFFDSFVRRWNMPSDALFGEIINCSKKQPHRRRCAKHLAGSHVPSSACNGPPTSASEDYLEELPVLSSGWKLHQMSSSEDCLGDCLVLACD